MAGIYIHIPYCKQRCTYCDFHFSTNTKNVAEMIDSMELEIDSKINFLKKKEIETIYIGGGTPSYINSKYIKTLLSKIFSSYKISEDAEVTIELNPDDITKEKILELKDIGINRLSIGVQSFCDNDLKFMNRRHNAKQAYESIIIAKENGIKNITIDLIYGSPLLTNENWKKNILKIQELDLCHFSAYALTVEPKTKLNYLIKSKKIKPLSDKKIEEQFKILQKTSEELGFLHYEISSFCKQEQYSKHNTSYWNGKGYIGIGPSAHSFDGKKRQWNIRHNAAYISKVKNKKKYFETEEIGLVDKYNEYIMTSLRTIWGIDYDFVLNNFNESINLNFKKMIKKWDDDGFIICRNGNFTLSKNGMLIADAIASDLFFIQNS